MTSFIQMARQMIADGRISVSDMVVLSKNYVAVLEGAGPQSIGEVSEIRAFIAETEYRSSSGADDDIRQRLAAIEAREARLLPLISNLFWAACEVTNGAECADIHKVGVSSEEISEVSTAALEVLSDAINGLCNSDPEFARKLEGYGQSDPDVN